MSVAADLDRALNTPGDALAPAAMAIARLEYPRLEAGPYLERIEALGREAARRVSRGGPRATLESRVAAVSRFLYDEQGFSGNREHYDDPRNSFLNEVLDRRTGIPITLALVYIEVARRADVPVEGVNFPGHFLVRASDEIIIDPFHSGALVAEHDCRVLLREHLGDDAAFDRSLLYPATRRQIITRMLVNLKRSYVRLRSMPQARIVADLLVMLDPSALDELRDRGLLAYHMDDFSAALRDLETYLRLTPKTEADEEAKQEYEQIWEHVKNLRRRVASFN
ncbi:MAG TPA: transglutaminase-like domain-containing protein [Vicinamibacterales bacterium]|nr:transglutaminase-like domain-containing protein [Vicinamibacterales bacterium]